jgi:tetraacyldisaccharide 4'-kinase
VAPDGSDTRTLPFGRLREPLDAASAADALLVEGEVRSADLKVGPTGGAKPHFTFSRRLGGPAPDRPAFAFAGIAKPRRFFDDLEKAGWTLTGRRSFGDHHHYSVPEVEEIERAARSSGATVILTTEKDIVRLGSAEKGVGPPDPFSPRPQITAVPLEVAIDAAFAPWLAERLRAVRAPGAA